MKEFEFKTVGVLMGGCSSERAVSLKSGSAIVGALQSIGLEVVPIDITTDQPKEVKAQLSQIQCDVAFNAVHGSFGEDGRLQQILEELDWAYTGCGVQASQTAFQKDQTQLKLQNGGVPVPGFHVLSCLENGLSLKLDKFPVVVKPAAEGSSFGVTIVEKKEDFELALKEAFRYGNVVLVEQYIHGRELTVGILRDQTLPIVEISSKELFFNFQAKYESDQTIYTVPAELPVEVGERVQQIAMKAFQCIGCEQYGRVDILLDELNHPYVLEINTIPGFTQTSLLPKAAQAAGISFTQLILNLLELAYGKTKKI